MRSWAKIGCLAGLLAPGCSMVFDLGAPPPADATLPPLSSDPDGAPRAVEIVTASPELCNGVDDDGDGLVDEGYADTDGNGLADCTELTCPALDAGAPGPVSVDSACEAGAAEVVDAPWGARVLWTRSFPVESGVPAGFASPVVAALNDDNGDGVVDDRDLPQVVVQTAAPNSAGGYRQNGVVLALSGATGTQRWKFTGGGAGDAPLVADLDGNHRPDVVTVAPDGTPVALNASGEIAWTAARVSSPLRLHPPIVADLAGDGHPELIQGRDVYDAVTGALRFELDEPFGDNASVPAVADLDLDGHQEIFYQGEAYDSDGNWLWTADVDGTGGLFPLVVQADNDPEAEIVWLGRTLAVYNADGSYLGGNSSVRFESPGTPCAGDLDDDGRAEIAFADGDRLYAFELEGQERWEAAINTTNRAGCSTFDLDGDRAAEILFADGQTLTAFDGGTGERRMIVPSDVRPAWGSYPVVADVNLDGHADILVAGEDGAGGSAITAFANDATGWASAGPSWPTYDYSVGNLDKNGSIPRQPGAWWEEYGVYRGRPAGDLVGRPDLTVEITDVCVLDCTFGPIEVAVQVANRGGREQYAGGRLVLYAFGPEGEREVASATLSTIPSGEALAGVTFELSPADIGGFGWRARVEDDGSDADYLPDCNPDNQLDTWTDLQCP